MNRLAAIAKEPDLSFAPEQAVAELVARDADLARAAEVVGALNWAMREPGFPALLKIIVGQQVSLASADAIWNRLTTAVDPPLTPEGLLALGDEGLRRIGFSRQKVGYARGLAAELAAGRLDLDALHAMEDEAALAEIAKLRGFGRWSGEMYLLFALGRPDVWPVDDLAIAAAVQRLKNLGVRPTRAELLAIGEPWRPWRSVAARLLWAYYRSTTAKRPR